MIDLEKIKARRACQPDAWAFLGYAPATIDTLVAEVEQLREDRAECYRNWNLLCDDWHRLNNAEKEREKLSDTDPLQPCGHPRSAIVSDHDLGGDCTNYCGMCEEKVAKQYADEAMMEQQVEEEEREGEYGG